MTQTRPMPPDFPAVAHMPYDVLRNRYHCATRTITRWRRECGLAIKKCVHNARPPDDFREIAPLCTLTEAAKRYKCAEEKIHRWERETGVKCKDGRKRPTTAQEIELCLTCPHPVCRPKHCLRVKGHT